MKRVACSLLVLAALTACDESEQQATDKIPPERPAGYYTVPTAPPEPVVPPPPSSPPPEPTPQIVVLAPPAPPKPPAPPIDHEPANRADEAAQRLAAARDQGPTQAVTPAPVPPPAPDPLFMQDLDWTRENAPYIDSGFPVDMARKMPRHWVLNGVLLDPINTSIPAVARVVIDSNVPCGHGQTVCLQKQSIAEIRYQDMKKQGDTRVNVRLIRIMDPAGAQIYNADDEEGFGWGADAMGQTGLVGDVDNRIWERYGTAFITAATAAIAAAAAPTAQTNQVGGTTATATNSAQALSQQLGQITAKVLEQTINLAPVVSIAAGENITLRLATDIYIRDPQTEQPRSRRVKNP